MNNLLDVLEVKRSYWDKYKNNINLKNYDEKIANLIEESFLESKKQFGYRRITADLRNKGYLVNRKKVLRIMQIKGMQAEYVRKMRKSSINRKQTEKIINKYPDLIQRNFSSVDSKYKVLYTDVTYLIFKNQRYYMSTIIDGFTKEIIDYKISKNNDNVLVLSNLDSAIQKIKEEKNDLSGIIIHSDHGFQYTSNIYKKRCELSGLIISMGKAYCCTDNVVIESFHSLLKKGTIHNNNYKSIEEYVLDVINWANWYNFYINKKAQSSFPNSGLAH